MYLMNYCIHYNERVCVGGGGGGQGDGRKGQGGIKTKNLFAKGCSDLWFLSTNNVHH